ncbi:MAG: ParB/RepB/Spo0J family partition protein, partial [Chloroflexota bacterium]|nr:ParB/RepB/Spo0J family partition protein [Chloroflexota bacterium]
MARKRPTGPRIAPRPGPHITTAQPDAPTTVYAGGDRILVGAREIDVTQLAPDPEQPRKYMDPDRLAELAESITRDGVLQALLVREEGMGRDGDMRYTIIAGGRRYAAIQLALAQVPDEETRRRLARVPVVVRDTEAAERRILQLVENLQREQLPPVEEARALKELMQLENLTTTGVAQRIHRSQGYVDERLRLIRHDDVATAVEAGVIPISAAAAVASIGSADERRDWIERAQAGETIRPREIYASKPDRRRGRRTSSRSDSDLASAALGQPIISV